MHIGITTFDAAFVAASRKSFSHKFMAAIKFDLFNQFFAGCEKSLLLGPL